MRARRRISRWSRALGIASIAVAVVAATIPALAAIAQYRASPVTDVVAPVSGLSAAAAGTALVLAVIGLAVGRRTASATAIIGGVLSAAVLVTVVALASVMS